jgi:hypothetical protein
MKSAKAEGSSCQHYQAEGSACAVPATAAAAKKATHKKSRRGQQTKAEGN